MTATESTKQGPEPEHQKIQALEEKTKAGEIEASVQASFLEICASRPPAPHLLLHRVSPSEELNSPEAQRALTKVAWRLCFVLVRWRVIMDALSSRLRGDS